MALLLTVQQLNAIEQRHDTVCQAIRDQDGATRLEILALLNDVRALLDDVLEHRYRNTGAQMMLDGRAHTVVKT